MSDQSQINDGGPAFPVAYHLPGCDREKGCVNECPVASLSGVTGISLRAWFAGKAIQGFMSNPQVPLTADRDVANACVMWADMMIAALKQKTNQ